MRRPLRLAVLASLVVGVAGATACWLLEDDVTVTPVRAGGDGPAAPARLDEPDFVRAGGDAELEDAGVGAVTGRVLGAEGKPVEGAEVLVFERAAPTEGLECGVCGLAVLECEHHRTVARVLAGVADGSLVRGPPLLRAVTDRQGRFSLPSAPFERDLIVSAGAAWARTVTGPEPLEVELVDFPRFEELVVRGVDGRPISGAQVTVLRDELGVVARYTSGADGRVPAGPLTESAWVAAELPGLLPAGGRGVPLVLAAPAELVVTVRLGAQPTPADIRLECHGPAQSFKAPDGVLRLQGLGYEACSVSASAGGLLASADHVQVQAPRTEVELRLQRGALLFVTVVTESGEPLEATGGWLSGVGESANASAEQGGLLEFGPLPEGEYRLEVNAPGMVGSSRQLDLQPGDNALEVVLRPALRVVGVVTDSAGHGIAGVRVMGHELDRMAFSAPSGPDGGFEAEVEIAGTYELVADDLELGRASVEVRVPGPAAVLVLKTLGAVELETVDFDGRPRTDDALLRKVGGRLVGPFHRRGGRPTLRIAGLEPGEYQVDVDPVDRAPVTKTVTIRGEETVRVRVQLERGANVSGRVLTADGMPVADATIVVAERKHGGESDEAGRFTLEGLLPGEVTLYAFHPESGASSTEVKVKAPARDVVITFPRARKVRGRVVDPSGTPVPSAMIDGERVGPDGRFERELFDEMLLVTADGYVDETVEVKEGDVGDVRLQRRRSVTGEVRDAEGRPVSGVTVIVVDSPEVATTDAAGQFRLQIDVQEPVELVASRGGQYGRARAEGERPVVLTLRRGTRITGRVFGAGGQGLRTSVSALSEFALGPSVAETDATGDFTLVLVPGVWSFSARGVRVTRTIDVHGDELRVVLGEDPGACGLSVSASAPIREVWLLPHSRGEEADGVLPVSSVAGAIQVSGGPLATTVVARGIPCGAYRVVAPLLGGVSVVTVELSRADHQVTLPDAPPEQPE